MEPETNAIARLKQDGFTWIDPDTRCAALVKHLLMTNLQSPNEFCWQLYRRGYPHLILSVQRAYTGITLRSVAGLLLTTLDDYLGVCGISYAASIMRLGSKIAPAVRKLATFKSTLTVQSISELTERYTCSELKLGDVTSTGDLMKVAIKNLHDALDFANSQLYLTMRWNPVNAYFQFEARFTNEVNNVELWAVRHEYNLNFRRKRRSHDEMQRLSQSDIG